MESLANNNEPGVYKDSAWRSLAFHYIYRSMLIFKESINGNIFMDHIVLYISSISP
jgi:hypothetical protein